MRTNQETHEHVTNIVRPEWWLVCWSITILMLAMVGAMFLWPDFSALWALLMVGGCSAIGMGYKSWKPNHMPH